MSIYGEWKTATIAQSGTTSGEVNLVRDYDRIQVILPALTSGTLNVQVSKTTGGTFQALDSEAIIAATTGGYSDEWEIGGWQFIKIVSSGTQSSARTIYVRGSRD
jgi:hypothetical protein